MTRVITGGLSWTENHQAELSIPAIGLSGVIDVMEEPVDEPFLDYILSPDSPEATYATTPPAHKLRSGEMSLRTVAGRFNTRAESSSSRYLPTRIEDSDRI